MVMRSSTLAMPNSLDIEKLLCELTTEEKISLTAGKCGSEEAEQYES